MPVFVDTNVLIYARDMSEPEKQERASAWLAHLWRSRDGRLSFQILQEYYVNATRKLKPALPVSVVRSDIEDLLTWEPLPVNAAVLQSAWSLGDRFSLSFWDSLVVAAAKATGCDRLLSEDLQDGQTLDGVMVVNPFRTDPDQPHPKARRHPSPGGIHPRSGPRTDQE